MKKLLFSGLIACCLGAGGQAFGQSLRDGAAQPGMNTDRNTPVVFSTAGHSGLIAYVENDIVIMRWGAGNEANIDHYVIEHSTDSVHFDPLHQFVSRGVNDEDSIYEDADPYPMSAVNFYRVVTFTKDGSVFAAPAVRVDVNTDNTPVLVPTVLRMGSTVRLDRYNNRLLQIDFFTSGGQLLRGYTVNSSAFSINTTGWPSGLYFYRISSERQPLVTAGRILIQ